MSDPSNLSDYRRIEEAIAYLESNFRQQPSLSEVAAAVGLSTFHFQRMFRRWAGISPKRFLQVLTADYVRSRLLRDEEILPVTFDAGLSSTSRLHELVVNVEAVTPSELRRRGSGVVIRYGVHDTPFGEALIATTGRGVCHLHFVDDGGAAAALEELRTRWPDASLRVDAVAPQQAAAAIFGRARKPFALPLHIRGTNFQIQVWQALLRLPEDRFASYEQIAASIGMPRAQRAVASAVARNPIAVVIPCHRVIRKTGAWGEYRWGALRKRAVAMWEAPQLGGSEESL